MLKNLKYSVVIISVLISLIFLPSCKEFLDPDQDLNVTKDQLFDDWYEYRSVAMGLYGLQQELVEQLVVLGELRADLLTVTPNADADLIEIHNFQASKTNKYANPTNFYKLISACNSFITVLKKNHPEILDKKIGATNYDKLYGEALCMRAWAYFNIVRIYGKVPVIHESLTSVEEIEAYINSGSTYVDKIHIIFGKEGFYNDTTYNVPITLEKQFYDLDMVIRVFSDQLEKEIKIVDGVPAVGVNHYIDNNDRSWEVTVWNTYAWHALLGQMYLTNGDFTQAAKHLNAIAFMTSDNYRYQLDRTFANNSWQNMFTNIDVREHIYTLWFNKANQQQNDFQRLFEPFEPHQYMLKPTRTAVHMWETQWRFYSLIVPDQTKPELTRLNPNQRGFPGDFVRGYGSSYQYVKNGLVQPAGLIQGVLILKRENDIRTYTSIMEDVDTIVSKYSIGKSTYDQDANFIIYRAGGIQLYLAEIYTWWAFERNGLVSTFTTNAVNIVNDGSNYNVSANREQLGVRGRAGFTTNLNAGIKVDNYNYIQDPFTNEVIGYTNLTNNLYGKQLYLEELIMDERARELAFEGERFYDLIRVAKRRNKPEYLADKVSAKFPASQRAAIRAKLMIEKNWYINIFD